MYMRVFGVVIDEGKILFSLLNRLARVLGEEVVIFDSATIRMCVPYGGWTAQQNAYDVSEASGGCLYGERCMIHKGVHQDCLAIRYKLRCVIELVIRVIWTSKSVPSRPRYLYLNKIPNLAMLSQQ